MIYSASMRFCQPKPPLVLPMICGASHQASIGHSAVLAFASTKYSIDCCQNKAMTEWWSGQLTACAGASDCVCEWGLLHSQAAQQRHSNMCLACGLLGSLHCYCCFAAHASELLTGNRPTLLVTKVHFTLVSQYKYNIVANIKQLSARKGLASLGCSTTVVTAATALAADACVLCPKLGPRLLKGVLYVVFARIAMD